MKKSGWGALGIAAYVLVRFAAVAMRHPDWNADDWVGFLGIVLVITAVVSFVIWLIRRLRTPKALDTVQIPATNNVSEMQLAVSANPMPVVATIVPLTAVQSSAIDTSMLSIDHRECSHCGVKSDFDAKFCCECGSAVA